MDALLADYAAGRLNPALHGLVAAHLSIKPDNRGFVASLEAMQAEALSKVEPKELSNREAMLAQIFAAKVPPARQSSGHSDGMIPAPLADFIGNDINTLKWRSRLPGIRECHLADDRLGDATLYWIKPGRTIPSHTHEGSEVTLVLKGGFSDATGHYMRGDVAIADGDVNHTPRADDGEDCICFSVIDAPLKFTGPVARFFRHFIR